MTALLAGACSLAADAQEAKYIFYFIGDGMGPNQVALAEYFLGEMADSVGISPIGFTQWPVTSLASTYSMTARVTDSAASGTALATGTKTANGCIGVASDKVTPLKSIAYRAKEAGKRVGISSSVGVNHATPAAFYGHQAKRSSYNELGHELAETGFDFFGGPDFYGHGKDTVGVYDYARAHGYVITRGVDDFKAQAPAAEKIIMLQPAEATAIVGATLPYAINRREGDMKLRDIVEGGIEFLTRDGKADSNGFFFMVEGGNIDWQCHSNDGATVAREVVDFDDAISVAHDFYLAHPDETLIVVTADHETGALGLGTGPYALNLKALANQKVSEDEFSRIINSIRQANDGKITWAQASQALADNFGFFTEAVTLTEAQEKRLLDAFNTSFGPDAKIVVSEYKENYPLSAVAKEIINEIALIGWGSGGHSAAYVPVFAIGAGADRFTKRSDNAIIPRIIAAAGGFPVTD
ncbi:MAG: alkaline phosphatase [Alloprevotella sp.]|nr:alkaline phosphatase [Alloprevotella sp.]